MGKEHFFGQLRGVLKKKKPKKQEKQRNTLPKNTKKKLIGRALWTVIALTFLLALFFIIQSGVANVKQRRLADELALMKEELAQLQNTNNVTDNLDVFGRYFVETYYKTANIEEKEYTERLQPYFASGIDLPNVKNLTGDKTLTSIQLWEKKASTDTVSMEYLVSYTYKERGEDDNAGTGKEIIHFEVGENDQRYSVVSYPYKQMLGEMTASGLEKTVSSYTSKEQTSSTNKEAIETWLQDTFFPRYYQSTDLDDVKYMMNDPVLLGNIQQVKSIWDIQVYDKDGDFLVKVTVQVSDNKTNAVSLQDYTLELSKESDQKYFVEHMTHTLGEED